MTSGYGTRGTNFSLKCREKEAPDQETVPEDAWCEESFSHHLAVTSVVMIDVESPNLNGQTSGTFMRAHLASVAHLFTSSGVAPVHSLELKDRSTPLRVARI